MEDNFAPSTSTLLCPENSKTCFDDDFKCNVSDEFGISDHPIVDANGLESFMDFMVQSDETLRVMVDREKEHLPKDDYLKRLRSGDLDLNVRRVAFDWIWKAHAYFGFGPVSFYLSVNYLDRFLSVYQLPKDKDWTGQLLAVACLSIAAKLEETRAPQSVDLQVGEPKFVFEAKSIQRMELLILSTLRWKMQPLIPCSFIDYFLRKLTCEWPAKQSISRSVQLIRSIMRCIDFLEFRPSEIAAAVAISVSRELKPRDIDKAITCFLIVEKERVIKCLELIRDLSLISVSANLGSNLASFAPQSPVGVVDAACLNSKSDELTVGSCTNSSHNCPNTKRSNSEGPSDGISN